MFKGCFSVSVLAFYFKCATADIKQCLISVLSQLCRHYNRYILCTVTYGSRLEPTFCFSYDLLVKLGRVDCDRRQVLTVRNQLFNRLLPTVERLQHFLRNNKCRI